MTRRPRLLERTATLEEIVENFKSKVDCLKEEIESWRDNMESNNMEQLPKFEEVSTCCDELEEVDADRLEVPENLEAQFWWTVPGRKPGTSRAARADAAASELEVAALGLRDLIERSTMLSDERRQAYDDLVDALDTAAEALRMISFPGMY